MPNIRVVRKRPMVQFGAAIVQFAPAGISEPMHILLLSLIAGLAGFIDSIAGGGGLLTLPALLASGLPPVAALATNKLQMCLGTVSATATYASKGHLEPRALWLSILLAFAGSVLGAVTVQLLDGSFLSGLVPFLLICIAGYILFAPRVADQDRKQRMTMGLYALPAAAIGFYDGFFGPGTGAFYCASMMGLLGFGMIRATANAKMLNLTANAAALVTLMAGGHVAWRLGLCMAVVNMAGNVLGSHMAMRMGARLIRPLLIVVSVAISLKLLMARFGWL